MDYAAAWGWCDVVMRRWVYRVIADTRKLKEVLHTTKASRGEVMEERPPAKRHWWGLRDTSNLLFVRIAYSNCK